MRIQTAPVSAFSGGTPSSILYGSGNLPSLALLRRISWLSDPTSWFARRVESQIQSQRRSVDRQSTMMWADYGVTISFVGGRLVLSLFRHNAGGSVVGYVVEETIGDEPADLQFASRGWKVRR